MQATQVVRFGSNRRFNGNAIRALSAFLAFAVSSQLASAASLQTSTTTLPPPAKPIELGAEMKLSGRSVDDLNQNGRVAGIGLTARFKDEMDRNLVLWLDGGVTFEAGAYQARFLKEYEPGNRLALNEASLAWK